MDTPKASSPPRASSSDTGVTTPDTSAPFLEITPGSPKAISDSHEENPDSWPSSKLSVFPKNVWSSRNKRSSEEMVASSSDPPSFPSDPLHESSSENYPHDREQKQHRRTSYGESISAASPSVGRPLVRAPRLKGPSERNLDSGLCMPSDEDTEYEAPVEDACDDTVDETPHESHTEDSIGPQTLPDDLADRTLSEISSQVTAKDALRTMALETLEYPGDFEGPLFPYWQPQPEADELDEINISMDHAHDRIVDCENTSREMLDLT